MKVKYFSDTDTLYIELCSAEVDETRDLDEDTLLDLDRRRPPVRPDDRARQRPHGHTRVFLRANPGAIYP